MSKIILQPSGNKAAQKHFEDTIANSVSLKSIAPHLTNEEISLLKDIYPNGVCKVWGVTSGGNNKSKWERIQVGDITLFSKKGHIYASAVTTLKVHNSSLAVELWGRDSKERTWEYIYFLSEIKYHTIPYFEFNEAVGYASNNVIQGFNVLRNDQSIKLINTFDLQSEVFVESISKSGFEAVIDKLEGLNEAEIVISSTRRLEQGYLKQLLFGRKTVGICACCKNEYPVSFLVTAHIKKRKHCSLKEKKDANVVMPMCKMGCDDLFEKGYVGVKNGLFVSMPGKDTSQSIVEYLNKIVDNECEYFSEQTRSYFSWHHDYHMSITG